MLEQTRSNRAGNRATRVQPSDHDYTEGLPVRQWRKTKTFVGTAPPHETQLNATVQDDKWTRELPMPRGSELYPAHNQALLRHARMLITQRPAAQASDFKEDVVDDDLDAEGETDEGFYVTKWAPVPVHLEQPEPEYLAARRNGLPLVLPGAYGPLGNKEQMRNIKVRKYDIEGNAYVWNVMAKVGQKVDGEIIEDDSMMVEAPAPGVVVEGVGVANAEGIIIANEQVLPTPPKRRPPPPKRKAKGPGRGRKKRPSAANGAAQMSSVANREGLSIEDCSSQAQIQQARQQARGVLHQEDIEMGDDSVLREVEDGSEEDEDEGDDGEDGDREEGELSPSPAVQVIENHDKRQKISHNSSPNSSLDVPLAITTSYHQHVTQAAHATEGETTSMGGLQIQPQGAKGLLDGDEDLFCSLERALDRS